MWWFMYHGLHDHLVRGACGIGRKLLPTPKEPSIRQLHRKHEILMSLCDYALATTAERTAVRFDDMSNLLDFDDD